MSGSIPGNPTPSSTGRTVTPRARLGPTLSGHAVVGHVPLPEGKGYVLARASQLRPVPPTHEQTLKLGDRLGINFAKPISRSLGRARAAGNRSDGRREPQSATMTVTSLASRELPPSCTPSAVPSCRLGVPSCLRGPAATTPGRSTTPGSARGGPPKRWRRAAMA